MGMEYKDVVDRMRASFPEEIRDCNSYLDMAQAAEADNRAELAYGLTLIAKDEFLHARFLRERMIVLGLSLPEEEERDYFRLRERVELAVLPGVRVSPI